MQKGLSGLKVCAVSHHRCSHPSQPCDPFFIFGSESHFEFFSQTLRKCWAKSRGGDGDLQRSPTHHSGEIEMAAGRLIHCVAQNASTFRLAKNQLIEFVVGSRRDNEEHPIKITELEPAALPDNQSLACLLFEHLGNLRCYNGDSCASGEQALYFGLADWTSADHQAESCLELHKHRKQGWCGRTHPSTPCGTRPGEGSRSAAATSKPARNKRISSTEWRAKNCRKFSPGSLVSR